MTTSAIASLWVSVLSTALVCMGAAGHWAYQARNNAEDALDELHTLTTQAQEAAQLRAGLPTQEKRTRTDLGLAPRFSAALTSCGVPASALSSISADAEPAPIGGDLHLKRRRASVSLAAVTLPQVGSVLASWREREPAWTITGIDLTPEPAANAAPGGDIPLRVLIAMESVLVDDTGGGR